MRKGRIAAGILAAVFSAVLLTAGTAADRVFAGETASSGEIAEQDKTVPEGEGSSGSGEEIRKIAVKADLPDFADGDRLVILSNASKRVMSSLPTGRSLTALISRRSGDSITGLFDATAVFTVEITDAGYRFRAEEGYLTAAESGNGLFLLPEPTEYSLWELQIANENLVNIKTECLESCSSVIACRVAKFDIVCSKVKCRNLALTHKVGEFCKDDASEVLLDIFRLEGVNCAEAFSHEEVRLHNMEGIFAVT